MNFVKISLKHKQVTLTILFVVFVLGVYSLLTMPRREDPKITTPIGLVIAYYPGASAAQVEEQVTGKIEEYLFQFSEVRKEKTYSTSHDGFVVIHVNLNDNVKNTDVFWSKLRHELLVTKVAKLPQEVLGPIVNTDITDTEAMLIALESKTASYQQLNSYCKLFEDRIRTLKATSKIKRIGGQNEQFSIEVNSQKLAQYGIGIEQIIKVVKSQNQLVPSGNAETDNNKVLLYSSGRYNTVTEIGDQIVGSSKNGDVIRLRDIAIIKREYAEFESKISVNGNRAMIVSLQMNEGNNIVTFGKDVMKIVDEVSELLPGDVKITTIVNQPQMVHEKVGRFLFEFLLAIISVVIVIILFLPFRIASVAAAAIPMTISVTFAFLHIFGIELHQVSLAALIVVLGMVVDDAIVVADNYVELLDRGVERYTAAWRSAFDLIVPIFTATITIIAAFMPMAILSGAIGEFIIDLPITVSIALACSFIVALVLTPLLCYTFIKSGIKGHHVSDNPAHIKHTFLDRVQLFYNKAIDWAVEHPHTTIGGSLGTIVLALVLFATIIGHRFFPYAERNQFVIEVWLPTGARLEKTQSAVNQVEAFLKRDERVVSFASFIGRSAPQVYYNFMPEFPVSNYAQLLVNTTGNETTEELAAELDGTLTDLVPDARIQVKLMQQGQQLAAPVEVRIFGDDVHAQKEIAEQVKQILKTTPGSRFVYDDYKDDVYSMQIHLKENAARLGFTSSVIAQTLYATTHGITVGKVFEGDDEVDMVVKLNEKDTLSQQNLEDTYLRSPVTGASVPLRQVASLIPEWQPGIVVHRNGVRCLTVRSETTKGVLPAQLLSKIRPEVEKIEMPKGFRIEYGGEYANKAEVFNQMVVALSISLVLIFLILLLQFRNLKETFIIIITIPLSLFGAVFGLAVTGNNFGFTAFVGLISLLGIVVRNAIILIDHTNELIHAGMEIKVAAVEAGKRRLRPILLTAMAAAIGVLPMIVSGSSLWSPLASVIAFGVTWSMIMAVLTVPVMYIMFISREEKIDKHPDDHGISIKGGVVVAVIALFLLPVTTSAQSGFTLEQLQEMALKNNRQLKIKELQVAEKKQKVNEVRVKFAPSVTVGGNYLVTSEALDLVIPQGSFGTFPPALGGGGLPSKDQSVVMSEQNRLNAGVIFYQPITQIPKISAGVGLSKTELEISETERDKASMQIKQAAEQLYFSLLILNKQRQESELKLQVANQRLADGQNAVDAGKTTLSTSAGLMAMVADEEQNLLKIKIQQDDLSEELKLLTGLSDTLAIALDEVDVTSIRVSMPPLDSIEGLADMENPDLKVARLTLQKAQYASRATGYNFIPDVGIVGGYAFQQGVLFYPENSSFIGLSFKWNIQDVVSNTYSKRQTNRMVNQATELENYTKEKVSSDVAKALRHLTQSARLIEVAKKSVDYRSQDFEIQSNKSSAGLITNTDYLTSKAALAKSEADLYAALLSYRMAYTNLQILTGNY